MPNNCTNGKFEKIIFGNTVIYEFQAHTLIFLNNCLVGFPEDLQKIPKDSKRSSEGALENV